MKVQWRPATSSDLPRIRELNAELEAKLNRKLDLPDVTKPPVILCMVAEENGQMIGGWLCECVAELQFFGISPRATASASRMARWFRRMLCATEIRWIFCNVPIDVRDVIGKPLIKAGFERQNLQPYALFAEEKPAGEKE